jgi:hypothetical protein
MVGLAGGCGVLGTQAGLGHGSVSGHAFSLVGGGFSTESAIVAARHP